MPRGKPFIKGEAKGRPKGAINHLTRTVRETVLAAFNELQQDPKNNILEFAKKNPRDFYTIAAKLIPTEVNTQITSDGIAQIIVKQASDKTTDELN